VAPGDVEGVQVSAVNVAGDLRGVQIGVVNVAEKVDGLMLGLVNVADDVEGVPIGLLSVTRTGGVHPVGWASSATFANVGLKFATKHTYTMVAAHYTVVDGGEYPATDSRPALHLESREFVGGGFFIGGHIPVGEAFVDFDASGSAMVATRDSTKATAPQNQYRELLFEPRLRIMAGYEPVHHLAPFVGTGLVELIGGLFTAVIAFVLLIRINATLTFVAIGFLLIFGLILQRAFKSIRPIFRDRGKINAEVTGRLTETLGGIRIVKGFHAEDREAAVFYALAGAELAAIPDDDAITFA